MTGPVSETDARFSDPDASPLPWEQTRRLLADAELFWICTVRAGGRPHATPLVAVWLEDTLYFCTGSTEQKAVNLRANPHVLLMTGASTWDSGVDVMVEGDAVRVTRPDLLQRLAEAWAAKWDGRWHFEPGDGGFLQEGGVVQVFSVAPAKVLAFGKGTFVHTRHLF